MRSIKATIRIAKKSSSDKYGRVSAVINYTPSKSQHVRIIIQLRDLTTNISYKIPLSIWDKKNKCCLIRGSVKEKEYYHAINRQIKQVQLAVDEIVRDCNHNHHNISSAVLSEKSIFDKIAQMENFTKYEEPKTGNSLSDYWDTFIERAKEKKVNHNGKDYTESSIKNHRKCLNILLEFENKKRHKYTFDEINRTFYDEYLLFMKEKEKHQTNTMGERIKNIKAIMKRAFEEGLHRNTAYTTFKMLHEEVDSVYLTEEELDVLYKHKFLPQDEMLVKYRDIFLVGCYTGLRWSDYKSIQKKDFGVSAKGNEILTILTRKTQTPVVIPILWKNLKEILNKYDYTLPDISEQKFNANIKTACLTAGINSPVVIKTGKYARKEPYEKWELVSSHTARRSACTNMYLKGIPAISIMKIGGWKKESTFLNYIKVSAEENADNMAEKFAEKF